jgi:hypothetical protein
MSTSAAIRILGQPQSRRSEYDDVCYSLNVTTLNYDQLELGLFDKDDGSLYYIRVTSSAYATSEGIRVGDSVKKVKKAYSQFQSQQDGQSLRYVNQYFGGLSFKISQGKISEIALLSASC